MSEPGEITHLLQRADQGDRAAADRLFRLVQERLRSFARRRIDQFPGQAELWSMELVDEAFMKLVGQNETVWNAGDSRKFFVYASRKMQDLLIESWRMRRAAKRPPEERRVQDAEQEAVDPRQPATADLELLLDLQAALARFERFALEDAICFRLRYFLGCTFEEVAEVLNISTTEAKRRYQHVKLWLQSELQAFAADAE